MCQALAKWTGKLGICIIMGVSLLLLVYMLPTDIMQKNVARSSSIFDYEGIYPQIVSGYKYMQLDNYTDSIMLGAAIYNGDEGIVDKAMNNYHIDCDQLSPEKALTNYANDADYDYYKVSYGRYWHGYLVPLKLLLLFFDYADIRILNFFLQSILLFTALNLFYKNKLENYLPAFLVTIFLLNPLTISLSLQYSSVYYILLFSVIYLLSKNMKGGGYKKQETYNMFFFIGVFTSYLDFLTYPLVTFGITIVLYLILYKNKMNHFKQIVSSFLIWGFGYAGMWFGKWIIGSLLTKDNLLADALNQILFRASSESTGLEQYNRIGAVGENLKVFFKWPFVILVLMGLLYFFVKMKRMSISKLRQDLNVILAYLVIAFLPIFWIFIFANHSREHYWFTYKVFSISCFALMSLGTYLKLQSNNNLES